MKAAVTHRTRHPTNLYIKSWPVEIVTHETSRFAEVKDLEFRPIMEVKMAARETGHSAAMKYFTDKKKKATPKEAKQKGSLSRQSLLGFSVGHLTNNKKYGRFKPPSLWSSEIFYQSHRGSYVTSAFHLEWQQFVRSGDKLNKLSVLMNLGFPRSMSFPIYVGVAAGPGVFLKSRDTKPEWAVDSRIYLGLRLTHTHSQYLLQTGFKNHLLKFRDAEWVGWFVSLGLAYRF